MKFPAIQCMILLALLGSGSALLPKASSGHVHNGNVSCDAMIGDSSFHARHVNKDGVKEWVGEWLGYRLHFNFPRAFSWPNGNPFYHDKWHNKWHLGAAIHLFFERKKILYDCTWQWIDVQKAICGEVWMAICGVCVCYAMQVEGELGILTILWMLCAFCVSVVPVVFWKS